MIDKAKLTEFIEGQIAGSDTFLVDVKVTPDNNITVEIDNAAGVDIDTCAALTRQIEGAFSRDEEDYQLEVGSAGLTSPFKVTAQYVKNIGNPVDVLTRDGRKLHGTLTSVSDDGTEFTIEIEQKVKEPGKKRPVLTMVPLTLSRDAVKQVTYRIEFK